MDLVGEFRKVKIDRKPFLVYHNVIKPLPQIHSPNSSAKVAIDSGDDLPLRPLFLCPRFRTRILLGSLEDKEDDSEVFSKYETSPLFDDTSKFKDKHIYVNTALTEDKKVFNCIECDFIICFKCATLPYKTRYKHDEHHLIFCRGDEVSDSDWCELCEGRLGIGGKKGFYKCNNCCTTLHISCLLGKDPYVKPDQILSLNGGEIPVIPNNSASRPICHSCNTRCRYPIYYEVDENVICFLRCYIKQLSHNSRQ